MSNLPPEFNVRRDDTPPGSYVWWLIALWFFLGFVGFNTLILLGVPDIIAIFVAIFWASMYGIVPIYFQTKRQSEIWKNQKAYFDQREIVIRLADKFMDMDPVSLRKLWHTHYPYSEIHIVDEENEIYEMIPFDREALHRWEDEGGTPSPAAEPTPKPPTSSSE